MELELMEETSSSPALCSRKEAWVRQIVQYVGRKDACVTSFALTQFKKSRCRIEVMMKRAHGIALTLLNRAKGHWMFLEDDLKTENWQI